MRCPQCGTVVRSPQAEWADRQLAAGRCIQCGTLKAGDRYQRCLSCRQQCAARAARRYAERGFGRTERTWRIARSTRHIGYRHMSR